MRKLHNLSLGLLLLLLLLLHCKFYARGSYRDLTQFTMSGVQLEREIGFRV
jgi:hypothetical protein